jgi:dihydropteroate synthase
MTNKKIMGILNVTPNSYFDGGKYLEVSSAIKQGVKLAEDGADIIDIGGCSTRPFSTPPSVEDEIKRVIPVIEALKKEIEVPLSIDTYQPEVAQRALDRGATFLNDVTGFTDLKMLTLAARYQVPICIMHMQDRSSNYNPVYPYGVVRDVCNWLQMQANAAIDAGVKKENIYLDPGIGFGKSLDDNFKILHNLAIFREIGFPLLVGLSRKTFLYITLKQTPEESLPATIAMNAHIYPNVDVFRVHDVLEHRQMITILNKLNQKANYSEI